MQQLDVIEVEQVSGGVIGQVIAGIGIAIAVYDAISDFREGWNEGVKNATFCPATTK